MGKGHRKTYTGDDVIHAEERFRETLDPMYAMLAIGKHPSSPPQWALEVCIVLLDAVEESANSGNDRFNTGRLLDEVVRYLCRYEQRAEKGPDNSRPPQPDFTVAARFAIRSIYPGREPDDDTIRNMRNAWVREAKHPVNDFELLRDLVTTARIQRVLDDENDEIYSGGFPYSKMSRVLMRARS